VTSVAARRQIRASQEEALLSSVDNQLIRQDCIEGLARLDAGSVDLVFADPPFNIGYDYDVYDDRRAADDYLDWSRRWTAEVVRVLKDDGTFWLAIGDEYAAELKVMLTREHNLVCRSWVIWYYTFGVNCKTKFSRSHAHLFHFVKDEKQFTFNDDTIRVPSARQLVYGDRRANPKGRLPDDTWILRPQDIPESFGRDEDTWYFPRVCGTFKQRAGWHGCQMPEQLLGRIIRSTSNPDDLVVDPFGGSGTTLAVAKKLGRRYLGYEISAEYANRIEQRLAAINIGDQLDGAPEPTVSAPSTKNGAHLDDRKKSKPGRRKIVAGGQKERPKP
jgi:site-specific DNA-methyltransferase (adenine-specific)